MIKAMDLTISNPHAKSQESDTDTETPLQTHLSRALSLTNGSFHNSDHQPTPPAPPPPQVMVVSYKECLKNHAASLGGLAFDGCGEFLPSPTANPLDPTSLKCAACGCHRNFHRRDPHSPRGVRLLPPPVLQWTSSPSPGQTSSEPSPSPTSPASPIPQQSVYPSAPHMLFLAVSTGHSGPIDENRYHNSMAINPHRRKRVRTKFSEEQKEKMYVFAEKLGWKMIRGNDDKLEDFCGEVGVKRSVFKVWMHNNKHRKEKDNGHNCDISTKIINDTNGNEGKGIAFDTYNCDSHNKNINSFNRYQTETKVRVRGSSPDGSSPSS